MSAEGINVRVAEAKSRAAFIHLWKQFMLEHEKLGGDIRATDRSLEVYADLFDAYVSGRLAGVAVMAWDGKEPCGALLWGEGAQLPFEVSGGRRAVGWGAYVDKSHRRQGISIELRERAKRVLRRKGIDKVYGSALVGNTGGVKSSLDVGFRITTVAGVVDLNETETDAEGMTDGFIWEGSCPVCATPCERCKEERE